MCLNAGAMGRQDAETETLIPTRRGGFFDGVTHALKGEGHDASEDGTGRGVPLVTAIQERAVCENPNAGPQGAGFRDDGIAYTLEARHHVQAVAFSAKDHGADAGDIAPTLRAGGHTGSHANGGVMPAVAFNWQAAGNQTTLGANGETAATLYKSTSQAVAGMTVRRLTPRECERLQGFRDDYTLIPWRGKPAPDGPRYKALGNSMAVPVMAWIGRRIAIADTL